MKGIILLAVLLLVCLSSAVDLQTAQTKHSFVKQRIKDYEKSQPIIRYSTATGTAHLVTDGSVNLARRSAYGSVSEGLEAFLVAHPEIAIQDPKTQLVEISRRKDAQIKTLTMITYQQVYKGLNVDGCLFKVIFNEENRVKSTSGTIVPNLDLDVVPKLSEDEAIEFARPALPQDMTFTLAQANLLIYRTDMTRGEIGTNHLAYHVIFKCTQHLETHYVYVDAHDGEVLSSYSPVNHALNRTAIVFGTGTVFTEGDQLPQDEQARLAVTINGVQYNAMKFVGDWDGWDLNGGEFRNTINVPTNGVTGFVCPNAAFYGAPIGALYCPGFAYSIDVIAHEFGHGYVRGIVGAGQGLIYQDQSGALNEAYADIMGETMQILLGEPVEYAPRSDRSCTTPGGNQRWVLADNLPAANQVFPNVNGDTLGIRDMYNPTCYNNPASTDDPLFSCDPDYDQGGVHINSGVLNQVYSLFVDGGEFKSTSYTGVGLTKAFHIFMRGLTKHTPTATFAQNADYVQAACSELVDAGVDLADLSSGNLTGLVVTTDDCNTLANLYSAVNMAGEICNSSSTTLPDAVVRNGPFPPVVLNVGVDYVYWQTFGFAARRAVYCRFVGGQAYNGGYFLTQWAEYSYCPMPAFDGTGVAKIQISADLVTWSNNFTITVIDAYSLTGFGPTSGPIAGGTTVQIGGEGFVNSFTGCNPTAGTDGFDCSACYFGYSASGVPVPATVDSATSASCVSPDWNSLETTNKTVEIWISMNYFLAIGPMYFEYQESSGSPVAGPVSSNVPMTSTPINFRPPTAAPQTQRTISMANMEVLASSLLILTSLVIVL
jgi:Zn-dependent metalloprotease